MGREVKKPIIDMVKLVSTDKDRHHKTGEIFEAAADIAEAIIAKGHATRYEEPVADNPAPETPAGEAATDIAAESKKGGKKNK